MATDASQADFDLDKIIRGNLAEIPPEGFPWDVRFRRRGDFELWLEGDVLACGCPDCGSPMSVRLWLKLADCWHCGTGIELSEELVEQAEKLLEQARREKSAAPVKRPTPPPGNGGPPGSGAKAGIATPPPPPAAAPPGGAATGSPIRRQPAAGKPRGVSRELKKRKLTPAALWWKQISRDLPAWIASLLLHLAALLLLAVWLLPPEPKNEPFITISTQLDKPVREGEANIQMNPEFAKFELPVDPADRSDALAMQRKDQDAKKLRIDREARLPAAPPIHAVTSNIRSDNPHARMIATRDPRVRVEMVKHEGGTTSTEAAVSRGLDWLKRQQRRDGSWSIRDHGARMESDAGGTSLALLPFLGAGQTHLVGTYQDTVDRGLGYLLSIQKPNGDLRGNSQGNSGLYAHGQAAIVLCEAYKLTGDEKLREPAQKSIDFIVAAQHPAGGWRYQPGEAGDLSVTGWQVMALYSAQAAGLEVPDSTVQLAGYFLDSVQHGRHGGEYSYLPRQNATATMTAEGLLCRMYLGWRLDHPGLQEGVEYLRKHLPGGNESSIYYLYYATQAMHHVGGEAWHEWNLRMRDNLVASQETRGDNAGSWAPRSNHDQGGGRLYATALATATLEVYYRHAPIFRQINLD